MYRDNETIYIKLDDEFDKNILSSLLFDQRKDMFANFKKTSTYFKYPLIIKIEPNSRYSWIGTVANDCDPIYAEWRVKAVKVNPLMRIRP